MQQKEKGTVLLIQAVANVMVIILGTIYIFGAQPTAISLAVGISILVTLGLNAVVTSLIIIPFGLKKMRRAGYFYLGFSVLMLWGMFAGNFVARPLFSYGCFCLLYGAAFVIGLMAYRVVKIEASRSGKITTEGDVEVMTSGNTASSKKGLRTIGKKLIKFGLRLCCYLALMFGILIIYTYIRGIWFLGFMIGMFSGMTFLFLGFSILNATLLVLPLRKSPRQTTHPSRTTRNGKIILVIGLVSTAFCFGPLILAPDYIEDARINFDQAFNPEFGGNWENRIPAAAEAFMLETPFTIGEYFLGSKIPPCTVLENQLYFNGSESSYPVDHDILLRYDAYLPIFHDAEGNPLDLPGKNSTIIRIHGGAWVIGDKGVSNCLPINKYLAAQGYCVFDIQYGLNGNNFFGSLGSDPRYGDFTIDDIMRHVGNFTQYLVAHQAEFGANLSSVFISGGSAGGQLTCATALGIENESYTDIFGSGLVVKGMIPYYPANAADIDFMLAGLEEWYNPELLVSATSPACLIFQGTLDPLIARTQSLALAYNTKGNTACAAIYLPLAGHASDLYFEAPCTQVFLYFMERFLYLYR